MMARTMSSQAQSRIARDCSGLMGWLWASRALASRAISGMEQMILLIPPDRVGLQWIPARGGTMHYETHQPVLDDFEARITTLRDSL